MAVIERLIQKLKKYPELRFEKTNDSVKIFPLTPDGFEVSIFQDSHECIVSFEGWHEHFSSEDEALNCLVWGLTPACRLVISMRGNAAHKWTVQSLEDNQWKDVGTTGLLFFNYFGRKSQKILQNNITLKNE